VCSSKTQRPSAAPSGSSISTLSMTRTNVRPKGKLRTSGPYVSRKKSTRCVRSSSIAVTSTVRPRFRIVARPAARRFRTQWTSPQGHGDLVSLDFAAAVDGWVGDSSTTIPVGTPREEDLRQIEAAERALAAGIAAAQPGNRLGDVSAAVGGVIRGAGYQVNTAFGGHGSGG
jgi:hypothetical protein